MLDNRLNTVELWHLKWAGETDEVDDYGDYTGESTKEYLEPVKIRANLSPAHGAEEDAVFGASINYSKILTTANMRMGIDEHSLLSDKEPIVTKTKDGKCTVSGSFGDGGETYRVVRVAKGRYHMRYALESLHEDGQ